MGGDIGLVRDQDDGDALCDSVRSNSAMISSLELRVEVAGRLVGQQQGGLRDQGAGDGDPLLLAAR